MATSIASALTRVPVRNEVAMTGEITLRGRVMPIGGLKEKLLAAHRNGITTVLVPKENRKDLREIPRRVLKTLRVVLVDHMDEVLREAMVFPEPDTLFGPRRSLIEYRNGELIERTRRLLPPRVPCCLVTRPASNPGSAEHALPWPTLESLTLEREVVAPRLRRGGGLTPAGCRVQQYTHPRVICEALTAILSCAGWRVFASHSLSRRWRA